jgi:hypothetical protein
MSRHGSFCAACGFAIGPMNDVKYGPDFKPYHRACEIKPTPPTSPTPTPIAFRYEFSVAA